MAGGSLLATIAARVTRTSTRVVDADIEAEDTLSVSATAGAATDTDSANVIDTWQCAMEGVADAAMGIDGLDATDASGDFALSGGAAAAAIRDRILAGGVSAASASTCLATCAKRLAGVKLARETIDEATGSGSSSGSGSGPGLKIQSDSLTIVLGRVDSRLQRSLQNAIDPVAAADGNHTNSFSLLSRASPFTASPSGCSICLPLYTGNVLDAAASLMLRNQRQQATDASSILRVAMAASSTLFEQAWAAVAASLASSREASSWAVAASDLVAALEGAVATVCSLQVASGLLTLPLVTGQQSVQAPEAGRGSGIGEALPGADAFCEYVQDSIHKACLNTESARMPELARDLKSLDKALTTCGAGWPAVGGMQGLK